MGQPAQIKINEDLVEGIAHFVDDPLGYVLYNWPWREPNTPLKYEDGPDKWQAEFLNRLGHLTKTVGRNGAVRMARRAGHGPGKSALIAWVIKWAMDTRPNLQAVVTANTGDQLSTKTWRELAKWHRMSRTADWCTHTATKFYSNFQPKTWMTNAIPWSQERPEAFAGTHEEGLGGRVLMVYDESSAIVDTIWETTDGAMTTPGSIWIVFGNPTRNTGRFNDCFGKFKHRWDTDTIDCRYAKKANQKEISQWIDDYGLDSDFVRVRVLGLPPRSGLTELIPLELIEAAMGKSLHVSVFANAPKVIGIDVARHGDDRSVIFRRQGLATWAPLVLREPDTMVVAARANKIIEAWDPDAVFCDVGWGAGVIDGLRYFNKKVVEVNFGGSADDPTRYANKRTEMWCRGRDWLKSGGALPFMNELRDDLVAPEIGTGGVRELPMLEKKRDTKKRIGYSPDIGDGWALTFAYKVKPRSILSPGQRPVTHPGAVYSHYEKRGLLHPGYQGAPKRDLLGNGKGPKRDPLDYHNDPLRKRR